MQGISITIKGYASIEDRESVIEYYKNAEPPYIEYPEGLPLPIIEQTADSYFPFLKALGECEGTPDKRVFLTYFNAITHELLIGGRSEAEEKIRTITDQEIHRWLYSDLSDELMLGPRTPGLFK